MCERKEWVKMNMNSNYDTKWQAFSKKDKQTKKCRKMLIFLIWFEFDFGWMKMEKMSRDNFCVFFLNLRGVVESPVVDAAADILERERREKREK